MGSNLLVKRLNRAIRILLHVGWFYWLRRYFYRTNTISDNNLNSCTMHTNDNIDSNGCFYFNIYFIVEQSKS